MKLVHESGVFFLDEGGLRIELTARELNLFRQMNPMGRRLTLRKRGHDLALSHPDHPEIELIHTFTRLPAREWSFLVPD
ncbi:MAG: hypothetical protein JWP91_578 [Fibrobacteres bacterium]|nr:hypothetical protein [Fibrobacterota bacterium]